VTRSLAQATLQDFCDRLADKVPSPGGGAVAAVTLAHAAALGSMVLRYTIGRPAFAAHEAVNTAALEMLDALRTEALALADRDAAAYARLAGLWKLAPEDPQRLREFGPAVQEAIDAPRRVVEAAAELARCVRSLVTTTNPRLASDLAIAGDLAAVAAEAAAWNVRVNLSSLGDATTATTLAAQTNALVKQAGTDGRAASAAIAARA
jgi:formiminotetrahydrofolate cyclodeaminase